VATISDRPLRRDAERNRQRILAAARELFAERGLGVSLDDIAHRAGVGVGTVYRRYPDKEQLIDAIFEERLHEILDVASESLQMTDPWLAVVHFLQRALELQCEDRALKEVFLSTSSGHERLEIGRLQIEPLVAEALRRAKQAGVLREDIEVPDLMMLQHAIGEVAAYTRDAAPEAWRRMLVLALDGLRPDRRRPSPMPVPAPDVKRVTAAMRTHGARARG